MSDRIKSLRTVLEYYDMAFGFIGTRHLVSALYAVLEMDDLWIEFVVRCPDILDQIVEICPIIAIRFPVRDAPYLLFESDGATRLDVRFR